MARVTVEDCLPLVDNRFALVLLAMPIARPEANAGAFLLPGEIAATHGKTPLP